MRVTQSQQDMIRSGALQAALDRVERCTKQGDLVGAEYNMRVVKRYVAMMEAKPVPQPPSNPLMSIP